MPQEAGTVRMLEQRGAGVLLHNSSDIVATIQNLLTDKAGYSRMRDATAGLAMPNSTEYIVREINALLPQAQTTTQLAA
jgi:UDP-N-acetylglucosamine:LPS N-acetylglucosamine transferase